MQIGEAGTPHCGGDFNLLKYGQVTLTKILSQEPSQPSARDTITSWIVLPAVLSSIVIFYYLDLGRIASYLVCSVLGSGHPSPNPVPLLRSRLVRPVEDPVTPEVLPNLAWRASRPPPPLRRHCRFCILLARD